MSTTASRELALYAINDSQTYFSITKPVIENLRRKIKRGVYDEVKARKAWFNVATFAAQRYHAEFGSDSTWHAMFPVSDRKLAADELAAHYAEHVEENQ